MKAVYALGFLGVALINQWAFYRTHVTVFAIAAGFYAIASIVASLEFLTEVKK